MAAIKRTPIVETTEPMGAPLAEEAGWLVALPVAHDSGRLVLADESHHGKLLIYGRTGGQAVVALGLSVPPEVGSCAGDGQLRAYVLRPDQLFISTAPGGEAAALTALLATPADEMLTVTDVTHGRAQLRLSGPQAAEVLSRLCALDFDDARFPNRTAQQTSVAKTTQLVIRDDLADGRPSYRLIGARSLGAYLWATLLEAGERAIRH